MACRPPPPVPPPRPHTATTAAAAPRPTHPVAVVPPPPLAVAPPPPVATSLSPNVSPNKKVVEAGVARTTTNVAQLEAEAENKDCELDVEWGDFSSACGGEEKPATSNEVLNGTASDYEAKGQETLRRLLESREMEKAQHLMKILAEKAPLPDWAK